MDEISDPELSLKILGHQWFWGYEISDFNSCKRKEQSLKYVCYMMVLDGLPKSKTGYFRLLETNKRVYYIAGLLNQVNLFIKRVGGSFLVWYYLLSLK